jgi:hypothetical protein
MTSILNLNKPKEIDMSMVNVTCENSGRVPYLGMGPIRKGVCIPEEQFESLKTMGYLVKKVAPASESVEEPEKEKEKDEDKVYTQEQLEAFTVKELKALLTEANVAFTTNANKAELIEAALKA